MKNAKVKIGNAEIDAEVAESFISKARGLMFRRLLPEKNGMLFVFSREAYHAIWMFGMRFPIDIIWIDAKKRIADVAQNARPCLLFCKVYLPKKKAKYVLEVNAGFVEKNRIKLGDKARF